MKDGDDAGRGSSLQPTVGVFPTCVHLRHLRTERIPIPEVEVARSGPRLARLDRWKILTQPPESLTYFGRAGP